MKAEAGAANSDTSVLILTYIDSGVLIFAAQGNTAAASLALPFLTDGNREYVTSEFVRLEVLPKAIYHKKQAEVDFYNGLFALNKRIIPPSQPLLEQAMEEARTYGLRAIDALHIACAVFGGAEELITSENKTKPIHRTKSVKVISIFP